ncbi:hypothetical protein [Nocardioides sp.]|uniref:hypothetical protein n=1 Tax=Nocardioides sp. TaxID=35761 RepID=UPI003D096F52
MTRWDDDEALMQDLDDALAGAVSDRARVDARAAFAWRTIDDDLMSLSHDSLTAGELLVRSAAVSTPRVVGFQGTGFSLEIEIDGPTMMGQVIPGLVCQIAVVTSAGEPSIVTTDEAGFFSAAAPAPGPVRFTVTYDGSVQSTEWMTL